MMEKKFERLLKVLLTTFALSLAFLAEAQPPPPPNGSNNTQGNKLNGNSAPIGSGLTLLIGMAAFYGAYKLNNAKKDTTKD